MLLLSFRFFENKFKDDNMNIISSIPRPPSASVPAAPASCDRIGVLVAGGRMVVVRAAGKENFFCIKQCIFRGFHDTFLEILQLS